MKADLHAPTESGHRWWCAVCPFSTPSLDDALEHCASASGDEPAFEHQLDEMPTRDTSRNRAKRVIACRYEGSVVEPWVAPCRWRYVDGTWEIKGVTING